LCFEVFAVVLSLSAAYWAVFMDALYWHIYLRKYIYKALWEQAVTRLRGRQLWTGRIAANLLQKFQVLARLHVMRVRVQQKGRQTQMQI